jgi:hypothetical protein
MQIEAENLRPGQPIRLSFRLPASETIVDASGIVVWVQEQRQGIRFDHVKNPQAIRDYISEVEGVDGV